MAFLTVQELENMEAAAEGGDINAQINMALLYTGGESVARDYDKAVDFLAEAGANAQDYETRQRVISAASGVHESLQREISKDGLLPMFTQKVQGGDTTDFEHKLDLHSKILATVSQVMKAQDETNDSALMVG